MTPTDKQIDYILCLINSRFPYDAFREIAKDMGCSVSAAQRRATKVDASHTIGRLIGSTADDSMNRDDLITYLWYKGLSGPEISRRVGIKTSSVYAARRRLGLAKRGRRCAPPSPRPATTA